MEYFIAQKIINKTKTVLVNGSGVDLNKFKYSGNGYTKNKVLMISRLLGQKGVTHFLEAAYNIKKHNHNIEFVLIGKKEEGKDSIDFDIIKKYIENKSITYISKSYKIYEEIKDCKIFVLPSIYREGMPRTMIEALAVGRPVIVSDIPGPKDFIINDHHGKILNKINSSFLTKAINDLINLKKINYDKLSLNCRDIAEKKFDINIIIKTYESFIY